MFIKTWLKERKEEKIIGFEFGVYEKEFDNECLIGCGSYGIVYKSIDKINSVEWWRDQ